MFRLVKAWKLLKVVSILNLHKLLTKTKLLKTLVNANLIGAGRSFNLVVVLKSYTTKVKL